MPKATFYTHVSDPTRFACRLTQRALQNSGSVLVWCEHEHDLPDLDARLWAFDPVSFLPHEIWQNGDMPSETRIILAADNDSRQGVLPSLPVDMVVLNLSRQFWPAHHSGFRVLEIVGADEASLATARERFRRYREAAFEIEHFNMQGKA